MADRWFRIKGEADGDRTLAEQLMGLDPMFAEVQGKSVLDLGAAEGLISIECARRGAASVRGLEIVSGHVDIARRLGRGLPCRFECADVAVMAKEEMEAGKTRPVDIVLALAILHKLRHPQTVAKYIAAIAGLAVVRYPEGSMGVIRDERSGFTAFDVPTFFRDRGFKIERSEHGPRGEYMHYFRRSR